MSSKRDFTVRSVDGTDIAVSVQGQGPSLILIDGALCSRSMGPSAGMATELESRFTVYSYDRRGRGASGDTLPYAVEREVEDIAAVLEAAGGEAFAWGISSGAVLALEAAARLPGIRKLALYEAPLVVDDSRPSTAGNWADIETHVAADRRGDAIAGFLRMVGMPAPFLWIMRMMPVWPKLKAVAHTLPHDRAIAGPFQIGKPLPRDRWSAIAVPVLVTAGSKSAGWMVACNRALAAAVPNARFRMIEGDDHMVKPKLQAPALQAFFGA